MDLKYFYDIGGDSIFAPVERDSEKDPVDTGYNDGGIVPGQTFADPVDALYARYNDGGIVPEQTLEELIAFLENRRG